METSIRHALYDWDPMLPPQGVSEDAVAQVWMEHQAIVCRALSRSPREVGRVKDSEQH